MFELDEGFNICLYGYGSKLAITQQFSAYIYEQLLRREPYTGTKKTPKLVVVNAYTAGTTIKDILMTVASAVVPVSLKIPNPAIRLARLHLRILVPEPPQTANPYHFEFD